LGRQKKGKRGRGDSVQYGIVGEKGRRPSPYGGQKGYFQKKGEKKRGGEGTPHVVSISPEGKKEKKTAAAVTLPETGKERERQFREKEKKEGRAKTTFKPGERRRKGGNYLFPSKKIP